MFVNLIFILSFCFLLVAAFAAYTFYEKNKITTGIQIQCSSGDSEVMVLNANFIKGESEESKNSKLSGLFQIVGDRREENHAKFLAIKAKAIEENEAKLANGEKLTLSDNDSKVTDIGAAH